MTESKENGGVGYSGTADVLDMMGEYSQLRYFVHSMLSGVNTAKLVKVVSVNRTGEVAPVGSVDVQPLDEQMTGAKTGVRHGILYDIPYLRIQGGSDAVILDPKVGDVGLIIVADKDISRIKATLTFSLPGSDRTFSLSDGLYLGGFLNGTPAQWVRFSEDGIEIHSPNMIKIMSPTVEIVAEDMTKITSPVIQLNGAISQGTGSGGSSVQLIGPVSVTEDVTAGGISLQDHVHGGVLSGPDDTGVPK